MQKFSSSNPYYPSALDKVSVVHNAQAHGATNIFQNNPLVTILILLFLVFVLLFAARTITAS